MLILKQHELQQDLINTSIGTYVYNVNSVLGVIRDRETLLRRLAMNQNRERHQKLTMNVEDGMEKI